MADMRAVLVAGATSGVGKTTIATGLIGVLRKHGLKVQPFKAGPDYIDPTYHTLASGESSRNLDTWLLSHDAIIELFTRAMRGKDIAVIEGVMGLYDGRSSMSEEGSTAELAKLLRVPVILVLDSRRGARSLAAMAAGYQNFDRPLYLGGVILNGIGSDSHLKVCQEAIEYYTGIRVLGYLPRRDDLSLPERHLGLIPTVEGFTGEEFLPELIAQCEATLNIDEILHLSEQAATPGISPTLFPTIPESAKARIAVARDKAFSFYYQDSLELLEAWGAEIVPFSPLQDIRLPQGISGLYIGGGFPELYAAELAANEPIRREIKGVIEKGMPVYAECGGLMYLGTSLRDLQGNEYSMVGAIPFCSQINSPRLSLGYRTVQALGDGPLMNQGELVRGHEFHWSTLDNNFENPNAYCVIDKGRYQEGFHRGNLLASYIHLHLGSLPSMAVRFIENCRKCQES